ncbi:hypothetical protein PVAND_014563 [Polypedilum vanderplanki]|uniref:Uncharacterized protein n=1 Tax=Polypedilum vanderplanki TaxID=319348 RepID=A0A9J6B9J5_POLVA|nr:hypothetical protein PVAND_014563 [Polypedilum vanderplanki]
MKIKEIFFVFFIAVCISQAAARSTTTTGDEFDEVDRYGVDRIKRETNDESEGNDDDENEEDDDEGESDEENGSDEDENQDLSDKTSGKKKKTKSGKSKGKKGSKTKKSSKKTTKPKKKCTKKCPKCTSQKVVPCIYRQKTGTQPNVGGGGDIHVYIEVNDEDDQNEEFDDAFVSVKTKSGGIKKLKYCDKIKGYKNKDLNDESDEDDHSGNNNEEESEEE